MKRAELEELRDHLQDHIRGITEILRKVLFELESPLPVGNEPYDNLEEILIFAESGPDYEEDQT